MRKSVHAFRMTTPVFPLVLTEGYAVCNLGRNVGQPQRYRCSCFATEAVRQGRPEPPPPPFQLHPSPRLRQLKGGGLQSHQASRAQQIMRGGESRRLTRRPPPE